MNKFTSKYFIQKHKIYKKKKIKKIEKMRERKKKKIYVQMYARISNIYQFDLRSVKS